MRVEEFPWCCGASVLCDFGHSKTARGAVFGFARPTEDAIRTFVSASVRAQRNDAFIVAVLNQDQEPIVGPILKEFGFACVRQGYHIRHNTDLRFYIRTRTE